MALQHYMHVKTVDFVVVVVLVIISYHQVEHTLSYELETHTEIISMGFKLLPWRPDNAYLTTRCIIAN